MKAARERLRRETDCRQSLSRQGTSRQRRSRATTLPAREQVVTRNGLSYPPKCCMPFNQNQQVDQNFKF